MLLHVFILACSSPPAEPSKATQDAVLSGYQLTQNAAASLQNQASELAELAKEHKAHPWTREEAEFFLGDLKRSVDALEATMTEMERSLQNSARSLHTSHHPR